MHHAKEESKLKRIEIAIVNLIFFLLWLLSSAIITWVFFCACHPLNIDLRFVLTQRRIEVDVQCRVHRCLDLPSPSINVFNALCNDFNFALNILLLKLHTDIKLPSSLCFSHHLRIFIYSWWWWWWWWCAYANATNCNQIYLLDLLWLARKSVSVQSLYNLLTVFIEKTSIW